MYLMVAVAIVLFSFQTYAAVPVGFSQKVVVKNLVNPTRLAIAPDGRIFIAEQAGRIKIVEKGTLLPQPFLNIATRVDSQGERGLLGIAFDPNFLVNQWVYVFYTSKSPVVHNRVSRFKANGDTVLPDSEDVLLDIQPSGSSKEHNAGAIGFGADGKLYIAVGDGGVASNAQSLANLKGKCFALIRMAVSRRIILFIIVRVASIELFGQKGSGIHIILMCSLAQDGFMSMTSERIAGKR